MNKQTQIKGSVHQDTQHDSAHKYVSDEAEYIDDIVEPTGLLHAYLGVADIANGEIKHIDYSDVRTAVGVVDVLTKDDIPGANDISPTGKQDEPVFADRVDFHGQALFAVVANTRQQARAAAKLAKIEYVSEPHITDVADAREANYQFVTEPLTLKRGETDEALDNAPNRIKGSMRIGGQDHFYLEGHIAMAVPGEDDDVTVYSSTQHPSEVQHMVAHVLDVYSNAVTVNVRRMGGALLAAKKRNLIYLLLLLLLLLRN